MFILDRCEGDSTIEWGGHRVTWDGHTLPSKVGEIYGNHSISGRFCVALKLLDDRHQARFLQVEV